jgi:hypothetical protein
VYSFHFRVGDRRGIYFLPKNHRFFYVSGAKPVKFSRQLWLGSVEIYFKLKPTKKKIYP